MLGAGAGMNPPFQNRAPLSFFISDFFKKLWKNRNSLPDFPAIFCAVQLRDIKKNTFFEVPPRTLGSVTQHTHVQNFSSRQVF